MKRNVRNHNSKQISRLKTYNHPASVQLRVKIQLAYAEICGPPASKSFWHVGYLEEDQLSLAGIGWAARMNATKFT